jgi:hypothetical protein
MPSTRVMADQRQPTARTCTEAVRHPICTDPTTPLVVTCYVRGDVTAPSRRQIEAVRRRLETLGETSLVADVRVRQWPPRRHATGAGADITTCDALVERFEQWADDSAYSLRPAIRRRSASQSLLEDDPSAPGVCVPVMLLELEYAERETSGPAGVIPYTVPTDSGDAITYTVSDWLAAAEGATDVGVGDSRRGEYERVPQRA